MSTLTFRTLVLALSMLVISGCPTTAQVKEESPPPPRNLLGTTDELQLVTELLASLTLDHGTEPILVVLGIDDTLLANDADSSCNDLAGGSAMPEMVQADTATQVDRMQQMNVKVIAISERPAQCAQKIAAELGHYQISFKNSAWPVQNGSSTEFTPTGATGPISYRDGVLLSSGQDKGKMLKSLLDESGEPLPGLVVMVDYQQRDLSQVMRAFAFSGTKVHAWRYTRVDTAQNL